MKTLLSLITTAALALTAAAADTPAPIPETSAATAALAAAATAAAAGKSPLEQLKLIRDQNAKLLDQQKATLKLLEELEKSSNQLKFFGKRS